jgi:hypothetical protein
LLILAPRYLSQKSAYFSENSLLTPGYTARTNRHRSKRRLGGGRAKKAAKQVTGFAHGIFDAFSNPVHDSLLNG